MESDPFSLFEGLKSIGSALALVLVSPAGASCWLERRMRPGAEGIFAFWTHVFALLPGQPGQFLRRAFYRQTLEHCSSRCRIGFGAIFSHREARVEDEVVIGLYAVIGCARLRQGTLIGTRASLLSGSGQHELGADGRWADTDRRRFTEIDIGPYAWIGEAATVMADVGEGSVVSAAAVVSAPVPARVVVAGNPARFIRSARPPAEQRDTTDATVAVLP